MRLLIGLAILAFVRGAPINDGAPVEPVQVQIPPETPALEEIAPELLAPPEEPKEILASEDLAAPEEEPASEEPAIPEEVPASEEPVTPEEELASEELATPEEVPAFEEPEVPALGVPETSKEVTKPEALSEKPINRESEPIPETHEEPAPDLSDLEAPIGEPYKPAPGSHPTESYDYNPLSPSLPQSEIIFPQTTFIDYLLWALFGDDNENETDDFNFLWPLSEPEQQTSVVNYASNPLQAEGDVMFMIWSD